MLPGLFEAFGNMNADVRKAVVFALVNMCGTICIARRFLEPSVERVLTAAGTWYWARRSKTTLANLMQARSGCTTRSMASALLSEFELPGS